MLNELMGNRAIRLALTAVLVLLALFLLVKTWDAAFGRSPSDPYNTITVEGTGRATAVPDIAQITFTVTEQAGTVEAAQTAATDKTNAAIESLKGEGIEEKDIKTAYYAVNPRYEYNQPCYSGMVCPAVSGSPRIIGYEVSQSIEVKVRDTAKAGDVLQLLGSQNVQNISGPNFTVDDPEAVRAEARGEAIAEAQEKAKQLSKQLGVRLGTIVSFSDNMGPYPMYDAYGMGGMEKSDIRVSAAAPNMPTGESETQVTVMITYEIH